jgi:hypothetical protein
MNLAAMRQHVVLLGSECRVLRRFVAADDLDQTRGAVDDRRDAAAEQLQQNSTCCLTWGIEYASAPANNRRLEKSSRRRAVSREPQLYFTFAVKLTETIKIVANSEDEARALLARGYSFGGMRNIDYKKSGRILGQEFAQGDIELLETEDPIAKLRAEREAEPGYVDPQDLGNALEERWQRLEARVKALEEQADQ